MERPFRIDMFKSISGCLSGDRIGSVLELGSGPGFLAEYLCQKLPSLEFHPLDFSRAMHQLARSRLKNYLRRVQFIERDFKKDGWTNGLGTFNAVVINQAVHELRHKRHTSSFHSQVRSLLSPGARYLVCDHFFGEGGMTNDQLFMTVDEQLSALAKAGFKSTVISKKGSLVLIQAM